MADETTQQPDEIREVRHIHETPRRCPELTGRSSNTSTMILIQKRSLTLLT